MKDTNTAMQMVNANAEKLWIYETAVILLLASVLTISAFCIYPMWDDAWLALLAANGGSITDNMADRPIVGGIWSFLDQHGLLWQVGYVDEFG